MVEKTGEEESNKQSNSALTCDSEEVSMLTNSREDEKKEFNKHVDEDTVSAKGKFKTEEDFMKETALMHIGN